MVQAFQPEDVLEIFDRSKSLTVSSPPPTGSEDDPALVKGTTVRAKVLEGAAPGEVQLKIGARLVKASLSQFIEPGREVKLFVAETEPRLVLQLMEEPPAGRASGVGLQSNQPPAPVERLPVLMAQVLDLPRGDRIRLRITEAPSLKNDLPLTDLNLLSKMAAGRELTARLVLTRFGPDLRPGQEVKFLITETSPTLVLQVFSPMTAQPPSLLRSLSGYLAFPDQLAAGAADLLADSNLDQGLPQAIQIRLAELRAVLTGLSPGPGDPDSEFLTRLLQFIGLTGERSPAQETTARLLSEILRQADLGKIKDSPSLRSLIEAAARFYEAVEKIQLIDQRIFPAEQTLLLSFPLFWPNADGRGEMTLKWTQPGSQDDRARNYTVTFLLFLTKLGRIKIEIYIQGKTKVDAPGRTVQGVVWAETRQVQAAIQAGLGRLIDSLEAKGLKVTRLSTLLFPQDQGPPESLAAELLSGREGLIDLRV